ncbi:MAG: hypothetical protein J0H98_06410 [Solirubrobacterales bacterium]|nr:hypothetical protein [Solirubrobacterales bacterium]
MALAIFACPIGSASAGEYEVWSCRGPDGQPLSTDAWDARLGNAGPTDATLTDTCATGGSAFLSMNPAGVGTPRPRLDFVFDLPRGAKITSFSLLRGLRATSGIPGSNFVAAVREVTGTTNDDWGCASTLLLPNFNCSTEGSMTDPDDPGNVWAKTGLLLDGLELYVSCSGNPGCPASMQAYAADAALFQSRVAIEDNDPPTLATVGGALAGGGPVYGETDLYVGATDQNAGVSSFALEIDGQPYQTLQVGSGTCSQPYTVARPCPFDTGRVFTIDASALSEGSHVASGAVTDAAGNQTPFGPINFTVENPGQPPQNGSPAVVKPLLEVDKDLFWHRPGKRVAVTGALTTEGGVPIGSAKLEVELNLLTSNGTRVLERPPVTTDAGGKFRVELGGQGSRNVTLSFAPGEDRAVTARAAALAMTRLKTKLKIRPRKVRIGKGVKFRGRLVGAGPAERRIPVLIQARSAGRWKTVGTTVTRRHGTFTWPYRFQYVKRDALFSFRAVIQGTPGWPWPVTTSPVRKVRISVGGR